MVTQKCYGHMMVFIQFYEYAVQNFKPLITRVIYCVSASFLPNNWGQLWNTEGGGW